MVTTASTPEQAARTRNGLFIGIRRRNTQLAPYHSESRNSRVPSPTITSQARWTTLVSCTVGRSPTGTVSRPFTTVDLPVLGSDSAEARPGTGTPPTTLSDELRW